MLFLVPNFVYIYKTLTYNTTSIQLFNGNCEHAKIFLVNFRFEKLYNRHGLRSKWKSTIWVTCYLSLLNYFINDRNFYRYICELYAIFCIFRDFQNFSSYRSNYYSRKINLPLYSTCPPSTIDYSILDYRPISWVGVLRRSLVYEFNNSTLTVY